MFTEVATSTAGEKNERLKLLFLRLVLNVSQIAIYLYMIIARYFVIITMNLDYWLKTSVFLKRDEYFATSHIIPSSRQKLDSLLARREL